MPLPHRLKRREQALLALLGLIVLTVAVPPARRAARTALSLVGRRLMGKKTVAQRLAEYGPSARTRLAPHFAAAGVPYPPARLTLVGLKQERELQVVAAAEHGPWRFVRSYPILAASGHAGPKLREGDRQVPEGVYGIDSLNPNSLYHLALRVDYPNESDQARAAEEGRDKLGGDIMIHGSNASVGCLAMGDEAAEDLFVLAADTGLGQISVVLTPWDLRRRPAPTGDALPAWAPGLYGQLRERLRQLPAH
ncbi:MAG: L,D-transpeptidase family protein [Armatimonadetes bacterium]|nr:L,D-transpeptidase family protein [Armatimonadota bacterium]